MTGGRRGLRGEVRPVDCLLLGNLGRVVEEVDLVEWRDGNEGWRGRMGWSESPAPLLVRSLVLRLGVAVAAVVVVVAAPLRRERVPGRELILGWLMEGKRD